MVVVEVAPEGEVPLVVVLVGVVVVAAAVGVCGVALGVVDVMEDAPLLLLPLLRLLLPSLFGCMIIDSLWCGR